MHTVIKLLSLLYSVQLQCNMQLSRTETVRFQYQIFKESIASFTPQDINHVNCDCTHCSNNTKPLKLPQQQRQTSTNQIEVPNSQSLLYILKKCTNYRGVIFVPEIIFLQEGMFFYTNEFGKLRCREKVTNMEAKKIYEERRQKMRYMNRGTQDREKQLYLLIYKSGAQQIMNDPQFSKVLAKRKNDPFWLQVAYAYKMPEPKQSAGSLNFYHFKRTPSTVLAMTKTVQKINSQIDAYDEKKLMKQETIMKNISSVSVEPASQQSQIFGLRNNLSFNSSSMQINNSINELQVPMQGSLMFRTVKRKPYNYNIKTIAEQLIAHIELTSKIRVLEAEFQYMEDIDGFPILIGFRKLIVKKLQSYEESYLHDRYKSLDSIGEKELIQLKKQLDEKDQQIMWQVCIQMLQHCLDKRKNVLKIHDYKHPTKNTLRQIFLKIFPNFSTSSILANINWKNEMPKFKANIKQKINKTIESDEGISILKRFNIHFYRIF